MRLLVPSAGIWFGLAWVTAVGWWLLRRLCRELSVAERLTWGFVTGLLVQIALSLGCLSLRIGLQLWLLALLELVLVVALSPFTKAMVARTRPERVTAAAAAVMAIAALAFAIYFLQAVSEPMWSDDFIAIWGLKAKTIFLSGSIPARVFHDPATVWSHPEYPLTLPLALASLSIWARGWDDQALALFYPACEAGVILLIFGFLKRRGRQLSGAVAGLLVASGFLRLRPSATGMADVPMALGFALAGVAAVDLVEAVTPQRCWRAALAFFFCASMKQEGVLFAALLCGLMAGIAFARRLPPATITWLAVPAALPPLILRIIRGPLRDRDFDWGYLAPSRWGVLADRLISVARLILTREVVPLAVPVVALVVYFLVTRRGGAEILLPVIGLQLAAYAAACAFSSYDPAWQESNSFARIAASLWPVLTLVLGWRFPERGFDLTAPTGPGVARG